MLESIGLFRAKGHRLGRLPDPSVACLSDSQQLVRLYAELPPRVREAIIQGRPCVLGEPRAIHGLQVEMLEVKRLEAPGVDVVLRKDQLELVASIEHDWRLRFG